MRETSDNTDNTAADNVMESRNMGLMQAMMASQAQQHEDIQRLVNPMVPPLRRGISVIMHP